MSEILIIAEKPSVAATIAAALEKFEGVGRRFNDLGAITTVRLAFHPGYQLIATP